MALLDTRVKQEIIKRYALRAALSSNAVALVAAARRLIVMTLYVRFPWCVLAFVNFFCVFYGVVFMFLMQVWPYARAVCCTASA